MYHQEIILSFMHAYNTCTYAYVVDLIILLITLLLPAPRKLCVVFSHSKKKCELRNQFKSQDHRFLFLFAHLQWWIFQHHLYPRPQL